MKKELSIFVDESGMFGDFNAPTKNYQITFVFHDQSEDISNEIMTFKKYLKQNNLPTNFYIHSGPLMNNKDEARKNSGELRRKLFMKAFLIFYKTSIKYKTFSVEKKYASNISNVLKEFENEINNFIDRQYKYFSDYDIIKIYYDRGRKEVSSIIRRTLCEKLSNSIFKKNISVNDYFLLQIADMVCTLDLVDYKYKNNSLTKSEINFFRNRKILTKLYLNPLKKKRFK